MDSIDLRILKCLEANGREKASKISQTINLSVSAVIERIKRMEAQGIIKGYTVVLDQKLMGKGLTAFISVRLEHPKFNEEFINQITLNSDVPECFYIAGDFDYMLKVETDSTDSLEGVLRDIKGISGVALTRTIFVLSTVKSS